MKLSQLLMAGFLIAACSHQVYAAAYIKFDGVDGESKDSSHDKWIDLQSIDWGTQRVGQPLIGKTKTGQSIQLKKDGTYHTDDGAMIVVVNGKIASIKPGRAGIKPRPMNPTATKGLNPQPEPPTKPAAKKDMQMKGKKILEN